MRSLTSPVPGTLTYRTCFSAVQVELPQSMTAVAGEPGVPARHSTSGERAEERKSEGRRRPVVKPAFGTEIRRWDDRRDLENGRPRRLKEREIRSWSRPLERIAKKVLPPGIQRQGSYSRYLAGFRLDFRTQHRVTSRNAHREAADGQSNNNDPAAKPQACGARMFRHHHFRSGWDRCQRIIHDHNRTETSPRSLPFTVVRRVEDLFRLYVRTPNPA